MLKTINKSKKSFLVASFLVFAGTWNIPKVDAVNTYNIAEMPSSSVMAAAPEWKKFSPDKGQFSILMPNEKIDSPKPDASDKSEVDDSTKMYLSTYNESVFMVSYTDFKDDITQVPPGQLLDSAIGGMVNGGRKLLSQKDITLDAYSGREIKVQDEKEKTTLTGRVFIVKQRMYVILVGGEKEPKASDMSKFFNSFQLIK
jgi:hypothetical protein